jgi:hypothetical protein
MMYSTKAGTLSEELKPSSAFKHGVNYIFRRRGALTTSGCTAIVFWPLAGERPTEAEIILIPIGMSFRNEAGEETAEHGTRNVKLLPHHVMAYPSIVHPTGRGTLRLASNDPQTPPVINHELVNDCDLERLNAACR